MSNRERPAIVRLKRGAGKGSKQEGFRNRILERRLRRTKLRGRAKGLGKYSSRDRAVGRGPRPEATGQSIEKKVRTYIKKSARKSQQPLKKMHSLHGQKTKDWRGRANPFPGSPLGEEGPS